MGIMTKQPKLEDGNHYSQTHAYSLSTIANSPLSPASTVAGSFTPRATSQAPTAQGIALRPSTLAPTTTAPNGYQPMPTGPNTGPMTSSIAVPARPKPGRKAATDEPDNKRKAQNRAAQRAFRERKTNVQKGLEYDNNVLRATNDTLLAELTSLRAQAEHDRNRMDALEQQVAESTARENESRTKWENNLTSMTAFQQQRQEAENRAEEALATARRCQDEVQRMTMELNMYKTRLSELPAQLNASASVKANSLSRPQVPAQNATITFQIPQKRQLVIDGCGDCEENGACPCVDSYVDDSGPAMSRDGIPPLNRNMSTASMSINNLLSPPDMNTAQKDSQSDVPELTSDQSSPEELEIDFTNHFAKVHSNTHIQTSDKCGFCYDPSNCICADTEATLQSVKAMALPVKTKPGTCIQCQQNPEQKAYCESLALQTKTERELAEGQPDPKRTRTEGQNITIGCADAYAVFKQVNIKSGGRPSFDDVYNTFMNSNPPSRRGTEAAANDMETKPRQFSAYETNIAAVLTTLGKDFRKNSSTD
jgi:hypothetical protein